LKRFFWPEWSFKSIQLQQLLPFTVLKRMEDGVIHAERFVVATALTVYGIETYYVLLLHE